MKIRSELKAGQSFEDCAQEREWWKKQSELMEEYAKSKKTTPPTGLWFPTSATQLPTNPPSYPTSGTKTVYTDMSGICR